MTRATFFSLVALAVFCCIVSINAQDTSPGGPVPPRCGPNESIHHCGVQCEDRCNALRSSACKDLKCPTRGCRCSDGFVRNPYTNECIKREQCPVDGCARGEIAAVCGKTCEGTCARPTQPEICQRIFCLKRECRCDLEGGFVRKNTGQCVRIARC